MPQPPADTLINDRYLLVRVIGQGGMGTVHLASDLGHENRPVALKRINPALVTPDLIESFKAEFDAMSRLNHPNVVQVFDFGTDRANGEHFFTMEYVDGGDLATAAAAWKAGSLPYPGLDAVLDLIVQACRGLEYIHARGLIHNDLKLQNFLLTATTPSAVKLSDFGLASRKLEQGPGMRGTMHYLAPETIQGAPADRRSDIYAFGVAIYRLLTGHMPLEGEPTELLQMIKTRQPAPPSSFNAEIPASLDDVVLQMLDKGPTRRPASAAQVIAALNVATGRSDSVDTPATLASYLRTARFVGRQAEMEKLTRLLDGARSHAASEPGVLVMLSGESGVGKSRLLRRVQQEAQLRGGSVALGQCYPDVASAFHPFIQILSEVCGGTPDDPDLQTLLAPRAAGAAPAAEQAPDAQRAQRRVVDAGVRALLQAAQEGLLLVLVEDLQWADSASINFLEHLARNSAGAGHLMLVATWRSEEADNPTLAAALERLEKAGRWQKMELLRLQRADISRMLAGMFGMDEAPREVVDLLQSETEGNPLFVQMAAESLVETGAVRRQGAGWIVDETRLGQIVFPRSVADAIGLRLSRLEAAEKTLLEALAVCGKPAGEELLASVLRAAGDQEASAQMAASVETLTHRRLAARALHDDGVLRLRIDHIRIRDHVYESMDWERRRALHLQLGLALESVGAADVEVLAHHFLNSADAARALSYAQQAGDHAMRLYAGERAASFLERAMELVPPEQIDKRLQLHLLLANAWRQARESARAIETYERVLRSAKGAGRKEIAFKATGDLVDALWRAGRHDEAQRAAERHLSALRAEGDKAGQAMCLTILGNIAGGRGQMAECRRFNEEALALHHAIGDLKGAASNLNNLGLIDLVGGGPTEQGRERLEEALSLHRELGDLQRATEVVGNLGSWHRMRGEYEQAARRLDEAAEMARSHRDRWLLAHFDPDLAGAWLALGVVDRALEVARRAVASAVAIGDEARQCEGLDYLGMIERELGHAGEAIACHEKAAALARRIGNLSQEGYALTSLALDRLEGAATDGLSEADQKTVRDLLRRAGKMIAASSSSRLRARLHDATARLALASGDAATAAQEAGRMLEAATQQALPDQSARAQLLLAICLAAQDKGPEASAAAAQAAADAGRCGLTETLWQAHALLAARELKEGRRAGEREQLGRAASAIQSAAGRMKDDQVRLAWLAEPRRADLVRRAAAAGAIAPGGTASGGSGAAAAGHGASGALSAIYEITDVINSLHDVDKMLSRLLDLGLGIVGAERGLIILKDEETGEQKVRAARDLEGETVADALAYSHSVVQEAASGHVIVALDAKHDERFRNFKSVSLYAIKSLLCVPMRYRGKILGTVYVDSRREGVPFSEQDLRFMEAFANLAATALEQARLSEKLATENVYLRSEAQERHSYQNLIGKNVKMQAVYDMMERVAASHLPVLIQGESGTGKELVARALHYASPRRQRKFLSENVAAIPDTLLESEMFGHVRGAFTGADRDRQGLFEQADGGTLFLDEIGDMSLPMQAKLLRALQEGEIRPVGGKESRKVNVRIISATNKDLDRMLKEARFREDLYWRLNVVRIPLPSLRERKEDIPLLVDHFLAKAARETGKPPRRMEVGALQLLLRYSWPGNVRELENEIQRLAVLAQGDIITQRDIIQSGDLYDKITSLDQKDSFAPLDQIERQQIERALVEAAGNRARAAELLGISRATIFRKLRQYNISH